MAHFAYIDDAGAYKPERDDTFRKRTPFYLRACVLIPASKWKRLAKIHIDLKTKYLGCKPEELKWQHLWQLKRRDNKTGGLSKKVDDALAGMSYEQAIEYARILLSALQECEASVWAGVTCFEHFKSKHGRHHIEKFHLQNIMQRLQMELGARTKENEVVVMFCDELATADEESDLSDKYSSLVAGTDPFVNYDRVNEVVSFVNSAHCPGVQLADFAGGVINGFLRGYQESEVLFNDLVSPWMRRHGTRGIIGYGIYAVPNDEKVKSFLSMKFRDHHFPPTADKPDGDHDIPF